MYIGQLVVSNVFLSMKNFWIKFSVWLVQGGVTSMTLKLIGMFLLLSLII